jgi:putative transposase
MARLARAVFPGIAHHVTQRGNGRAQTFFGDDDYIAYRALMTEQAAAAGVEVWSWVLMPNHVHLVLVPADEDGLRRMLAPLHRRYAGRVHARLKRTGHFWQGRFGCVAMDEAHLGAALRYVALNPVRARLAQRAVDWPWSSVHVHLGLCEDDGVTAKAPVLERYPDFADLIAAGEDQVLFERLRKAEGIGRPLGDEAFVGRLERQSGRSFKPAKRGPKPKAGGEEINALSCVDGA